METERGIESMPLSRASDPETSRIAAALNTTSRIHADLILAIVRLNPYRTAAELGEITGLGHIECARRLPELRSRGHLINGDPRECSVKHSRMITWRAI